MVRNAEKLPWSKFFWTDYDGDEGLKICSLAAQGLWMRMLCLMARATPAGELRIGREPCTAQDLAKSVGESKETVECLLDELLRRGVYSTTRAGVIYSRRMRKDAIISRKRAEAGKKGGDVSTGKQKETKICSSKNQANGEAKFSPRSQKPESKSYNNQPSSSVSAPEPDGGGDWLVFAEEIRHIAGCGPRTVLTPVRQWLESGIPREVIKRTVEAEAAKVRVRAGRVSSLNYFDQPVQRAWKEQIEADDAADDSRKFWPGHEQFLTEREKLAWMNLHLFGPGSGREWPSHLGPPPDDKYTEIPSHVLEAWRRERASTSRLNGKAAPDGPGGKMEEK